MVTADDVRNCNRCAYNLVGLRTDGLCPECGTPVINSIRGVMLRFAGFDYLYAVRRGLTFIIVAQLASIAAVILQITIDIAVWGSDAAPLLFDLCCDGVHLGVSILLALGYISYTTPDPGFIGVNHPDTPRKVIRAATLIIIASEACTLALTVITASTNSSRALDLLGLGLAIIALIAYIAQFFALMLYTQWMARRIPDNYVIEKTKQYMWLLPLLSTVGIIACFSGPIIALVLYLLMLFRMRSHLTSILTTGKPADLPGRHA